MIDQHKIYQLSDTVLYREAQDFIMKNNPIDGQRQMYSLVNYTQSWDDLNNFVKKQKARDWLGSKAYYKQFFAALDTYLNQLRQRVEQEWFPPQADLNKQAKKSWLDDHAIVAAREFLQHLAAENLYREKNPTR